MEQARISGHIRYLQISHIILHALPLSAVSSGLLDDRIHLLPLKYFTPRPSLYFHIYEIFATRHPTSDRRLEVIRPEQNLSRSSIKSSRHTLFDSINCIQPTSESYLPKIHPRHTYNPLTPISTKIYLVRSDRHWEDLSSDCNLASSSERVAFFLPALRRRDRLRNSLGYVRCDDTPGLSQQPPFTHQSFEWTNLFLAPAPFACRLPQHSISLQNKEKRVRVVECFPRPHHRMCACPFSLFMIHPLHPCSLKVICAHILSGDLLTTYLVAPTPSGPSAMRTTARLHPSH